MSKNKIKWEVQPAPTGHYRSFQRRDWPYGRSPCNIFFMISCEDKYCTADVKTGNHKPLKLLFRDDSKPGCKMFSYKRQFATLPELKEFASNLDLDHIHAVSQK